MSLAQSFLDELGTAKRRVTDAVGPVLVTMLDGMGYVIVPASLVFTFLRVLERADAKQAQPVKCPTCFAEKPCPSQVCEHPERAALTKGPVR